MFCSVSVFLRKPGCPQSRIIHHTPKLIVCLKKKKKNMNPCRQSSQKGKSFSVSHRMLAMKRSLLMLDVLPSLSHMMSKPSQTHYTVKMTRSCRVMTQRTANRAVNPSHMTSDSTNNTTPTGLGHERHHFLCPQ